MQEIIFRLGSPDWMASRLTPRRYHPPIKPLEAIKPDRPLTGDDLNPSRPFLPEMPGAEGIGVQTGKCRGQWALMVQIAPRSPFEDSVRLLAKRSLAAWNGTFNYWEIPILSQVKGDALKEAWNWIEEAFFEIPWSNDAIELHWNYGVSDRTLQQLEVRVKRLNNFWSSGVVDLEPLSISLVYPHLSQEEVETKSLESFRRLLPSSVWIPQSQESINRLAVNYLRHRESAYHLLLNAGKPYLRAFRDINQAIAEAYPWLKEECDRQIKIKSKL